MSAHYFKDSSGFCGIVHLADIYRYKGFTFEFHRYCGPVKLVGQNLEPTKREGKKFYAAVAEWEKLTPKEKLATQIYG